MVQYGAVWCSVVQCGAVWCSVLQCVAVCCKVWQSVAMWCSDVSATLYIFLKKQEEVARSFSTDWLQLFSVRVLFFQKHINIFVKKVLLTNAFMSKKLLIRTALLQLAERAVYLHKETIFMKKPCIFINILIHKCKHGSTLLTYMYIYVYIHLFWQVYIHIYACIHMFIHMYLFIYIYIYV